MCQRLHPALMSFHKYCSTQSEVCTYNWIVYYKNIADILCKRCISILDFFINFTKLKLNIRVLLTTSDHLADIGQIHLILAAQPMLIYSEKDTDLNSIFTILKTCHFGDKYFTYDNNLCSFDVYHFCIL